MILKENSRFYLFISFYSEHFIFLQFLFLIFTLLRILIYNVLFYLSYKIYSEFLIVEFADELFDLLDLHGPKDFHVLKRIY